LALGRLGWQPDTFYRSRLLDLHDALAGYTDMEEERRSLQIMQTRKTIAWLVNVQLPKSDRLEETEIWPLPIDSELEKKRREQLPISTVTLGQTE
jgi:hypothetical protein